jgi:DNA polymerase I-like protein with 3'-5' exonuclease and polymerase domains
MFTKPFSVKNPSPQEGVFANTFEAALDYRRRGWKVTLAQAGTKEAFQKGWQATTVSEDHLVAHCRAGGAIGIQTGLCSQLLDVDLDCVEARLAAPCILHPTALVSGRPGSPRSHWFYRSLAKQGHIEYVDIPASNGAKGKMLVELRGEHNMTMAPPSPHPDGGNYFWDSYGEPATIGDIRYLLERVRELAVAALLARTWPRQHGRHEAHKHLAGALAHAAYDQAGAERIVKGIVAATEDEEGNDRLRVLQDSYKNGEAGRHLTGWPTLAEVVGEAVVSRARQWLGLTDRKPSPIARATAPGKATPRYRPLPPYQPFPVEALPSPIAAYVREGALALCAPADTGEGCDPAYLALPALAVVASVIGNTRTIRLKRTWEEPAVVWSVIVGDSGTLKSPAYQKAVDHLFHLQRHLSVEYGQRKDAYDEDLQTYKAPKRGAKDDGSSPGEAPDKPIFRRVVASDTTVEKLAEILEDNPRGTLVARDELAGWLGSFCRYKGKGGGSDLPNWLEMHRAGTVIVDRKTGERRHYFIPRAAVSVTGGIQPGVFARALTQEFLDAGLAARLLPANPPKVEKRWSDADIPLEVEQAYQRVIDRLLALEFDHDQEGEERPHALKLSPEAKAAWVRFYNEWAREQAAAEGELAAAFSKLEAYAARFALIHHVVERVARGEDDKVPIVRHSIEAGETLCRWFAAEARRIYSTLSETQEERDTRRLVEFVRARRGKITARALQKSNSRKYPDAQAATAALDALADGGYGWWEEATPGPKGGQPARVFHLHPAPGTTDTTDDDDPSDDGPREEGPSGTTPDRFPESSDFQANGAGSVGSAGCRVQDGVSTSSNTEGTSAAGGSAGRDGVVPGVGCPLDSPARGSEQGQTPGTTDTTDSIRYIVVNRADQLPPVLGALDEADAVALDVETTGLDPRQDRPRLMSLALPTTDGTLFAYLIDLFAIDAREVLDSLAGKDLLGHNLVFDLAFLDRMGFTPTGKVHDTLLLSRILYAGEGSTFKHTLTAVVERELGEALDKTEQRSDWSVTLTDSQLAYAGRDVLILPRLNGALTNKVGEAHLERTADIEMRCLPPVAWMSARGVAVDRDAWLALVEKAEAEAKRCALELDRLAPTRPGEFVTAWKWTSSQDIKEVFTLLGFSIKDTEAETIAQIDHPIVAPYLAFRESEKRVNSFGRTWLENVHDGRLYPSWNQTGAKTGRMSCSNPNLQQTPRDPAYRRCVIAPPGRVLIKADYSQIELRIAARIAEDERMIEAYRQGEDLHTLTARSMTGRDEVTKQERQLAKPVNFGLIYGLSAKTLRVKARVEYGVELTAEQAEGYRAAFFTAYEGIARWHRRLKSSRVCETRTLAGRRVLVDPEVFYGARANYAVQGTCGDGIKLALALLWERRDQVPGAFPVMAVHDEIVVEADAGQADAVAAWLKQAMLDGMAPLIDPVPVGVEVTIGRTWAGD